MSTTDSNQNLLMSDPQNSTSNTTSKLGTQSSLQTNVSNSFTG